MKKNFYIYLVLAMLSGFLIAWVDSRPTWDDTGITALFILMLAALLSYLAASRPWLIALALSIWIPLYGIITYNNYEGLLALVPGFIGAFSGYWIQKFITTD